MDTLYNQLKNKSSNELFQLVSLSTLILSERNDTVDIQQDYNDFINNMFRYQEDMFLNFREKINKNLSLQNQTKKYLDVYTQWHKDLMFKKVVHLKSLFQPEQRSPEWYDLRQKMFTASADVCDILGLSQYGGNINKVIMKKCGEGPKFTGNKYTWHGQKYEDIACQIYESRYNYKVWEFGLIPHPHLSCLGASPDGITTCGRMLEIKVPSGRKIDGKIKIGYYVQMQAQMEVCDLDICDFFECNIVEYDKESYDKDIYIPSENYFLDIIPRTADLGLVKVPDDRRTEDGLEKGLIGRIGEYSTGGENKYFFPPMNMTTKEQENWLLEKQKNHPDMVIDYWRLETNSINHVKRDRQWWKEKEVTRKLLEAWKGVEYARLNGTDHLLSDSQYMKKYGDFEEETKEIFKEDGEELEHIVSTFLDNIESDDENMIDLIIDRVDSKKVVKTKTTNSKKIITVKKSSTKKIIKKSKNITSIKPIKNNKKNKGNNHSLTIEEITNFGLLDTSSDDE